MEGRKAEGLENAGAVERARSALATSQGELAALDEALVLARNRIAVLLGAGPDRGLTITRPAPIAREDFGLPANLPAELIGRRPDIIAARLRSEAAASRIKEARAAFYPNINLAGLIGLQALGLDNVFKSGSEFGTVGPAISLPIFDGGSLRGRYRASEADYREAVAQYYCALIQALREIADSAITPDELRDSYVMLYQDVQPAAAAEEEQDRLAIAAPVETSEEDVLRALQQEAEALPGFLMGEAQQADTDEQQEDEPHEPQENTLYPDHSADPRERGSRSGQEREQRG